ncbi:MAG TPA: MBL fold metallo-hydrolase [Labilithrix sp.]|nr:MBL fold metallo-hydrolase [Labilithrix sp.]
MKLLSIEGNTQRLDGGAMFGNCPRPVWEKWAPPDERNRITLACRALLAVEEASAGRGPRNVLLEAGIGAFFEPKMRERFGVQEDRHVLVESLAKAGIHPSDIDVVVLSHLHFDHAGGLLTAWREGQAPTLVFPNAAYVVSDRAWARAKAPHSRDRASFIPELQELLEGTGRLEVVSGDRSKVLGDAYSFTISEGHTPGLMLTRVEGWSEGPVTFLGDLVPGMPWVHLPITMGYDRYPELLIDEKKALLDRIVAENGWAFFTHDPNVAAARVERDAKGKYVGTETRAALS